MKHTLEASKLFSYITLFAVLLFIFFAYKLFTGVETAANPLGDKMDAKIDAINSIPKGNKKSVQ